MPRAVRMRIDEAPPPRWAEHPAPEPLTLLQGFANTHAYSGRPDHLATATSAHRWLRQHGVAGVVTTRDLPRLTAAREAIRDHLRGHDLRHTSPTTPRPLEHSLPRVTFTWSHAHDTIALIGTGHGLERFLNDLAAAIVSASLTGVWRQLKVCSNDECSVAFWDHTKNGSARYCSAAGCANRSRQRAFRARTLHS